MLEPNDGAADVVCIILWGQKFFYDIVFMFDFVSEILFDDYFAVISCTFALEHGAENCYEQ